MNYDLQVHKSHYSGKAYRSPERWSSYWHQLNLIRSVKPSSVLEIGLGEGVVAWKLKQEGIAVTTVDIAEDLRPDVVGSVMSLPFEDNSFDLILAAEILEHIRFEDIPKALSEIARVSRNYALVSVPHPGYVFSLIGKIPLVRRFSVFFQIPFFWKKHRFNGEHYWELGKRQFSIRRLVAEMRKAGLLCIRYGKYADDPAHRFFLLKKLA